MRAPLLILAALVAPLGARAQTAEQAQALELEKLRARVAGEIQLAAYDLLDQLVYEWTQAPPFGEATPVFVADVTVPVGLGTGLGGLMENHLAALLLANPSSGVTLSHCPACTAVMVHAGREGTIISRGLDNPEALAKVGGAEGRYGLYLDLAAEGAWLVLRARITRLTPDLPIVYSRTISSAVGTPSLLRDTHSLKSAAEARREYLDAINDRGPFRVPIGFGVRSFEAGEDTQVVPAPVAYLQTGFDVALSQARAWTSRFLIGFAWLPEAYTGFTVQARLSRLLSGTQHSLTGPDVYLFLGGAVMYLDGAAIAPFTLDNADQVLRAEAGRTETRAVFGGVHLGLELELGNRISAAVFLENLPSYNDSGRIGSVLDFGLEFHSFGTEVTLCF